MQVNFVDFETGDLSKCLAFSPSTDALGNPLVAADSANAHRGSYSVRMRPTGETAATVTIGASNQSLFSLPTVFYGWYFYLSFSSGSVTLASSLDAGGNAKFTVGADNNFLLYLRDATGILAQTSQPIALNRWVAMGLMLGTGPGAAVAWRYDGELLFAGTSTDNGLLPHAALRLGSPGNESFLLYADDVAVDDSNFPALLSQTGDALGMAEAVSSVGLFQPVPARILEAHWGPLPGRFPFPS